MAEPISLLKVDPNKSFKCKEANNTRVPHERGVEDLFQVHFTREGNFIIKCADCGTEYLICLRQ